MEHTLVRQILRRRKLLLINKKTRTCVLTRSNTKWNIIKTKPLIVVGEQIMDRTGSIRIMSYDDFIKEGFVIVSVPIKEKWFSNQRCKYVIAQKTNIPSNGTIINGMPFKHALEVETSTKRVRLYGRNAGPNGFGPWVA